jgi:fucose permease
MTAGAVACALFVPTGLITVMLGPLLPDLSTRWSLTDAQAGYLFTAQFVGSLVGTLLSGRILARLGFRWTMISGAALMAFGVATLISGPFLGAAFAVFSYGMGNGLTVPASNLLVAQTSQERSVSLNLLNFFWGAGAVLCPFLLALFHHSKGLVLFLAVIVASLAVLIAALLMVPIEQAVSIPPFAEPPPVSTRTAVMLLFGTMFFLYVGTESAIGAWLATYTKRVIVAPRNQWITAPAYFYGALLLGRLAAPWTLRRISDVLEARLATLLATAAIAVLLNSRTFFGIVLSAAVVGFGFSTLYPIAIGLATASLGEAAARVMGTLFAFSTLGGACLPWLVGYLSTRSGNLTTALLVPLAGCAAIALLYWNPLVQSYRHGPSSALAVTAQSSLPRE